MRWTVIIASAAAAGQRLRTCRSPSTKPRATSRTASFAAGSSVGEGGERVSGACAARPGLPEIHQCGAAARPQRRRKRTLARACAGQVRRRHRRGTPEFRSSAKPRSPSPTRAAAPSAANPPTASQQEAVDGETGQRADEEDQVKQASNATSNANPCDQPNRTGLAPEQHLPTGSPVRRHASERTHSGERQQQRGERASDRRCAGLALRAKNTNDANATWNTPSANSGC